MIEEKALPLLRDEGRKFKSSTETFVYSLVKDFLSDDLSFPLKWYFIIMKPRNHISKEN